MLAAAGSFAAISTLLGSPLTGAFLLMEASGLGGPMLQLVLVPGLLAAGVGSLIFIGLDAWTGLGTFALAIPGLPPVGTPTAGEFLWALAIGVLAVPVGSGLRWLALLLRPHIERRMVLLTPAVGLAIAGLAIAFAEATGKSSSEVLFSGQSALGPFITNSASYTVGALLLLIACKGLAYGLSLSSFRGGPTFPALFVGAVGGVALSHLPGLPVVPGVAMGIGAMSVVMLRLPLTSVLLASLLLASDGLKVMPLVIVAVVVAFVTSARFTPPSLPETPPPATEAPEPQATEPQAATWGTTAGRLDLPHRITGITTQPLLTITNDRKNHAAPRPAAIDIENGNNWPSLCRWPCRITPEQPTNSISRLSETALGRHSHSTQASLPSWERTSGRELPKARRGPWDPPR